MACVTLKRPLDHFESPLLSPPGHHGSPPVSHHAPPTKRRRCTPLAARGRDSLENSFASTSSTAPPSVFRETPLSAGEIASNLRDELKRLRRRRQLAQPSSPARPTATSSTPGSPEPMMDDASAVRAASTILGNASSSHGSWLAKAENKPIFTLKQMTLICERMCKERTDQVREEYDRILQQKLSEQYESFVKFIDQQIQQRFNGAQLPSYLS